MCHEQGDINDRTKVLYFHEGMIYSNWHLFPKHWSFGGEQMIDMHKLEVALLREHRPLPNASIIELLNDFCNAN